MRWCFGRLGDKVEWSKITNVHEHIINDWFRNGPRNVRSNSCFNAVYKVVERASTLMWNFTVCRIRIWIVCFCDSCDFVVLT